MSYAIRVEGLGKRYDINRSSKAQTTSIRDQLTNGALRLFGRAVPTSLAVEGEALERAAQHELALQEAALKEAAALEAARNGGTEHDEPDHRSALERSYREPPPREQQKEFWALRDVGFEVGYGERIGIIGANGAGKSTLLKILSRITAPTEGRIEIRGKVASLLEVGTGFHPELSGRENIYLNGAILGMTRTEIKAKFDQIVAFSGVEKFIDTPVKHYSSGMYVRLAFSVSAWLDPDILIVDEVLAVGDTAFQKKCAERIKEMTKEGRTVLFVSHSMATVNQTCHKALYLENGRVVSYSPVEEATVEYQRDVIELTEQGPWHRSYFDETTANIDFEKNDMDVVQCMSGQVIDANGVENIHLDINKSFSIVTEIVISKNFKKPVVPNFHFYSESGERFFISLPAKPILGKTGKVKVSCLIPPYLFNVGRFTCMVAFSTYELVKPVHVAAPNALRFEMQEGENVDLRRNGYLGTLPGLSRVRLDWDYE